MRQGAGILRPGLQWGEAGQVIVEYVIVFPLILMLTLMIIQLAHLFVAKQVVSYAALCSARAALVDEDYQAAAKLVCSPIAGSTGVGAGTSVTLPGWGGLRGSAASDAKTQATLIANVITDTPSVTAEVTHDFELLVPVANRLTYDLGQMLPASEDLDMHYGAPHLQIRSRCTLSKPWTP
jgi:Flp pilus assembly protein TadG